MSYNNTDIINSTYTQNKLIPACVLSIKFGAKILVPDVRAIHILKNVRTVTYILPFTYTVFAAILS